MSADHEPGTETPLAPGAPGGADDWKRMGDEALEAGDQDRAFAAYLRALEREPEHAAARYNLALLQIEREAYPEALSLLGAVVASRPDDVEALGTLGWATLWSGRPAEAIAPFERALALDEDFAPGWIGLGWAHLSSEPPAPGRASEAFAWAIALESDDPEAYYGLATACELRGAPAEAVPLLEECLRRWPDQTRAHASLARVLEGLNRWDDAAHQLMQLAHRDPLDPEPLDRLAEGYAARGAHERALVFWRRRLKLAPDATVATRLGDALMAAGDPATAAEAYLDALNLDPDNPEAYARLGHAYHEAGRPGDAASAFTQATKREPRVAAHYYNLGNAYLDDDAPETAAWAFHKALQLDPALLDARVGLGWATFGQNRLESARETFELALRQDPNHLAALDGLGSSLWREGVAELALHAFERAYRLAPGSGGLAFKLGMIHEELGQLDRARQLFQEARAGTFAADRVDEAIERLERRLGP